MNPLNNPWAVKEPPPKKKSTEKIDPPYLGVRAELAKAAVQSSNHLTFEVRGISSVPGGAYKVEYSSGASLRYYLQKLKLQHAATYAAVYDQNNLEKGRCRMTYVPSQESKMLICNSQAGSAIKFQRTNVDAERSAANMGRKGGGPAPLVVTKKLR